MHNRLIGLIALGVLVIASPIILAQQSGQTQKESAKSQTFDSHDLNGVWFGIERNTTGKEVSPFTPYGQKQFDANKPFNACADCDGKKMVPVEESNDPMLVCDPLGFPRNIFYEMRHMEFVQTPTKVVQLFQYNAVWREIWTDGRPLPANVGKHGGPDPRWYGYSVGKWDGNTFVVDSVGMEPSTWLDAYGDPHSDELKVQERYTRLDHDHLKITVLVDDPKTYTKPFLGQPGMIFSLTQIPLPEEMCVASDALAYNQRVGAPADAATKATNGRP